MTGPNQDLSKPLSGKDAGTALITVLVMLAIMSTLALTIATAANTALQRTSNQAAMDQARWYLFGAEAYALRRIGDLRAAGVGLNQSEWQGKPLSFPLDGGGVMTITVWDGSNCINLNSVSSAGDDDEGAEFASLGRAQFARLLDHVGVAFDREDGALVQSLADWTDANGVPQPGGAEDAAYANRRPAYRAANTLLADFGELQRVAGFTEEALARIKPYACARPNRTPTPLNVNTLLPEQAVVLATVLGERVDVEAARRVIMQRPVGGWMTIEDFLRHPVLVSLEMSQLQRTRFSVESAYYVMVTRVVRGGAAETSAALIEAGTRSVVVRRVFGAGQAGRYL
jgi:general secretion pathway protein K